MADNMQHSELDASQTSPELDELIARFLGAVAAGEAPERGRLMAENPGLADELRTFFDDHDWMAGLAKPAAAGTHVPPAEAATLVPTSDAQRYVGLQPHAKGGLGEVLRATDREFNRIVALKRLRNRYADDPQSQRRFLTEAEITARLDHPGVVPVHGMFEDHSGRPSYVMRFIEGDTLAEAIAAYHAGTPDPVVFRRLLQSVVQVCLTIGYAHSRGIIHRDLKPSNIMLGKFGETLVVDWGLSKVIGRADEDQSIESTETLRPVSVESSGKHETQMGSAVGTPAYMSPEQAAGRWDVIGPASDIYGLGAVLYTLLAGQPLLEGDNWPEINQHIQRGDFPRPRQVQRAVPQALEAICLKALALEPDDRYRSASSLASDVERWLADEPVKAYREPMTKRFGRWARHHKPIVAAALALLLTSPLVGSGWIHSLERERVKTLEAELSAVEFLQVSNSNMNELFGVRNLFRSLEEFVDWFTNEVPQTAAQSPAEFEARRSELLHKSIAFWDEAIRKDEVLKPSGTSWKVFYRIQRAQCLAHLGESDAALTEAGELAGRPSQIATQWVPHLLRVYAVALQGASDQRQSEHIAAAARDFVRNLANDDYFEDADRLKELRQDPQLEPLLSRESVGSFLDTLEANSYPTFPN